MSLLPLISHHLYVAAVANEVESQPRPEPWRAAAKTEHDAGRSIPLEVMDYAKPMPLRPFRPLRVSARAAH